MIIRLYIIYNYIYIYTYIYILFFHSSCQFIVGVFARPLHSTSEFAKIVLSKCVNHLKRCKITSNFFCFCRSMGPSCKRMPTKLCMMVEARADHPGVPAMLWSPVIHCSGPVSNWQLVMGRGPTQEARCRNFCFVAALLSQSVINTSEVSRMKVFENNFLYDFDTFQIWFVVMICLWLGFAFMILIWFQLWFWYGFSYDSWCGSNLWFEANPSEPYPKYSKIVSKPYQNRIKTVSKSYQKRIKIVSKSYQNHKNLRQIDQKPVPGLFLFLLLKPTHWNHIKIISKSYQNRIKTISKSYQNHKNHWKLDQKHVPGLFLSLFLKPTHWNHIKTGSKSYQNRIKIVSKAYQKRIKTRSKSYHNHKTSSKHRPKTYPCAVSVSFFEANSLEPYQNRIKIISKSYQNRIKIVSKPYQNHIEIITPNSKHIKIILSNRIQNHIKIVKKIFPEFSILEGFRSAKSVKLGAIWLCWKGRVNFQFTLLCTGYGDG